MQTGSAPNPTGVQACGGFQLNPAATPFDPNRPDLRALSEFEADLWIQWDQEAFAWEDEERSCTILTWFIDHTWHWPHCDHPRRLQLYEDHRQWEAQILRRWQDVRDHSSPFELYVVTRDHQHLTMTLRRMSSSYRSPSPHGSQILPPFLTRHKVNTSLLVRLPSPHMSTSELKQF